MALYQQSVLNKYLSGLKEENVKKAYQKFQSNFQTEERIKLIRSMKEEEYQAGFLNDLFVEVLGYTLKPNNGFNIELEKKNKGNSKKADGAIIVNGEVETVIELKGTNTTDIRKIEYQAFGYKNTHAKCKNVITSNFAILRLYVNDTTSFEDFYLFELTEERFKILYLLLRWESMSSGLAAKIKNESVLEEEQITKQFYKDYSNFKGHLFESIKAENPDYDELLLFKKTQKLLDRLLFVFFAEDKGLLPPNSISRMVDRFNRLQEDDAYKPLYEIFQQYFGYFDKGRKGKKPIDDIFAYNGGLFYNDEILDKKGFKMSDKVLRDNSLKLSAYDFDTEIDVNILGHIFEHSLNEIEEVSAKIRGEEMDKTKSKRKKDGVFYTPSYITKYIVENTIGKLCDEKKEGLGIEVEEYLKERKGRKKTKLKALEKQLSDYQAYLLSLRICDPAVGSGAFLNQAFNYLLSEHEYIAYLRKNLFGEDIQFDVANDILEKNLYGVDLNEESVDIAKLSLWLRTARKGRTLASLNNNLKCGNSLIDDPKVAGKKAFNWEKEFPEVFANGGFDVVIGNPPYVRAELLGSIKEYLESYYSVFVPSGDLFFYFYEKSISLLRKKQGIFGFISNTFDKTNAGIVLRKYLQEKVSIDKYIDFTEVQIFEGATTYPIILTLKNLKPNKNYFNFIKIKKAYQNKTIEINSFQAVEVNQESLDEESWSFKSDNAVKLLKKLSTNDSIKEKYGKSYRGLLTGLNEAFIIPKKHAVGDNVKLIYEGKELKKWSSPDANQQLILFQSKWTKKQYGDSISENKAIEKLKVDYPNLINQILPFEERAKKRYDKGEYFWELRNCAYYDLFEKPKVVFPNLQNNNKFSYDESGAFINAPAVFLPTENKFLISILNSKLIWYFLTNICVVRSGGYIEVKPQYFEQIPITEISNSKELERLTEIQIKLTQQLNKTKSALLNYIYSKYQIEKFSKKLQNWDDIILGDFLKELNKIVKKLDGKKLTKSEEMEWMELFETKKSEVQKLKEEIDKTDKEIDQMVYQLYGLTGEEIKIVENS